MADAVRELLEGMVPELHDLVAYGLLTKPEVRLVIKKRTDFEYRLRKRAADKTDFVRYVQYELTLDKLLSKRKERLKLEEKEAGKRQNYSCAKQIHFIFDRAVKKFKADVPLWLEWIAYAKSQGSSKVLSKIFARALQIHPRDASLWIHAAAWEFEENRNVTAARSLLQRGLRLNGKSRDMWREYFKMEVLFVTRLIERRRVLGLGGQDEGEEEGDDAEERGSKGSKGKGKGKGAIDIPDLDEEAEGGGGEGVKKGKKGKKVVEEPEGLKDLLEGSIPLVVLRFAASEMTDDPDFILSLYDVCSAAGDSPLRSKLRDAVLEAADSSARGHPGCAVKRACLALEAGQAAGGKGGEAKAVKEAGELFGRYAKEGDGGAVREAECAFWREVAASSKEASLSEKADGMVIAAGEAAIRDGCATETIEAELIDAVLRLGGGQAVAGGGGGGGKKRKGGAMEGGGDAAGRALDAARRWKGSVRLWTTAVKLAGKGAGKKQKLSASSPGEGAAGLLSRLISLLDEALEGVGAGKEAQNLWVDRVKLEVGRGGGVEGAMGILTRCMVAAGGAGDAGCVLGVVKGVVDAAAEEMGVEGIRSAGKLALSRPMPEAVRRDLLWCLAEEELEGGRAGGGIEAARVYLEAWAGSDLAKEDAAGWLRWAEEEDKAKHHKAAQSIKWRAQRVLSDPSSFLEAQAVLAAGK